MNGIYLNGNWETGWAIDLHTISSFPIGNGMFDTKRTEIGEALYQLKYRNERSQIPIIAKMAINFLKTKALLYSINVIIPVPPSNLKRVIQPVFEIARSIGEYFDIYVDFDYLIKVKNTEQLKGIDNPDNRDKILKDAFKVKDLRYRNKKVLVFDDLYRSGATLREITRVLYKSGRVQSVYVLTLTKTRTKR